MRYREQQKDKLLRDLCKIIVQRIEGNPDSYIREAIRWNNEAQKVHGSTGFIQEWDKILHSTWKGIRDVLSGKTERSRWLRKSCPFQGIITDDERLLLLLKSRGRKATELAQFKKRCHIE